MSGTGRATRNNPAGAAGAQPPAVQPPPPQVDPVVQQLQQQVQQLQQQLLQVAQQAQQPVAAAVAPGPVVFVLNPAARVVDTFDFSDKIHVGLHAKVVASLYGDGVQMSRISLPTSKVSKIGFATTQESRSLTRH